MAEIFEDTVLAGIELGNRLVRSATWEGMADPEGRITPSLEQLYRRLAAGGVGLVISSYLYVEAAGKQNDGQIGVYSDALVRGLSRLAKAVHDGGGKIVGQIVHCGGQADRRVNGGVPPVAPSPVPSPGYPEVPAGLTDVQIRNIQGDFAAAACRLKSAGFDGVQMHGAHGYLLAQFLSPVRNQRQDRYGGSLENRSRFTLEVLRAIRKAVGSDFPVMIKLNANDFLEGSTTEEDACFLASELAREGIAAIEVSGGTPGSGKALGAVRPDIRTVDDEAYFLPQARAIRRVCPELPLMLVGGLRSPKVLQGILRRGEADYFSLCRPLIREPGLPARWRSGDTRRAGCVSCLGCFRPARTGEGIRCMNALQEDVSTVL